jgi:transcriptional regulator with XRE-family HTH domain
MVTAPPIRRRLVGRELRRYRESLGLTLEDAARTLECDRSKISRIETGERGIRGKELRELLDDYGVTDDEQALLMLLADRHGASGWLQDYAGVLPGAWRDYLTLETAAARIDVYEAQQVPALLQTPAYARALAETDPALKDDDARDLAAEAVTVRQRAILAQRCPEVHVVIGEAALHQRVGTEDVMGEQLNALAAMAADSGIVTVQVLPFESGAHAAVGDGSVAILRLADAPALGLVHLGGIGGGVCLEDQSQLEAYARVFDQLRTFALSPAQSALLLRGLAGD